MVADVAGLFPADVRRQLLVGLDEPDDAAVYNLGGTGLVFTADYFPPVVDDPFTYGAIAANNALGDVFAMGGRPLVALNLATFPDDMPVEVARAILAGAAEQARLVGAVIAGGHTVSGRDPSFGLAVLGVVNPDHLIRKSGAAPGDRLVLTKPLGVGVITTAGKRGTALPEALAAAVASMRAPNLAAAEAAVALGVRCGTDVTGFGLVGHALEMAEASGVQFCLRAADVPLLAGALHHAGAGDFPGGSERNADYFSPRTEVVAGVDPLLRALLFSPETAGGLLLAVPPHALPDMESRCAAAGVWAVPIGEVRPGKGLVLE